MKKKKHLVFALLLGGTLTLQAQKVTLHYQNQKLEAVLSDIRHQTGMTLAYSAQFVDLDKKVTVIASSEELSDVLTGLFQDTDIGFEIRDNKIFLFDKKKQQTSPPKGNALPKRSVSGTVTDENGDAIIGASIMVKGSDEGTVTDIDGKFSLELTDNDVLQVSYIGYLPISQPVKGKNDLTIRLQEDSQLLEEVVVIGYGTTTVKNSTGSISSVKSEDIQNFPATNFASSLSGKMTGVQVSLPSGIPGSSPVIKVRGTGTLTAGSNPLIVVDGFPLTEGSDINSINANSIQSIEVLKDAASTAIYGSRGANGIIMITTKQGSNSKPQVTLSANFGIQQRYDKLELVNAYDMAQYMLEARNTGYVNKDPLHRKETDDTATRKANGASKRELIPDYLYPYLNGEPGLTDTDWLDEIFQLAPLQDYNVSINGGSEKASYALSAGYMKQDGILIGSDYEKFSANANLKLTPAKAITVGFSISPSYAHSNSFDTGAGTSGNYLYMASIMYPFFAPYKSDGTLAISEQIIANTDTDGALGENPVAFAELIQNDTYTARVFGNMYGEVAFLNDFKFRTSIGGDFENSRNEYFKPSVLGTYRAAAPQPATASQTNTTRTNFLIENTLTYNKQIKEHFVQVLLGQSYQREDQNYLKVVATDFSDDSVPNIAGGASYSVTPDKYAWAMISYFTRVNYNVQNKYMFSGSIRRDGSSRFGRNTKWGLFPAFSGAWMISGEDFLQGNRYINYAKLRLSWGKSGNNQIPNYGSIALMQNENYLSNGSLIAGTGISSSPNPDLSWEMSSTWNVGFDMTLFDYLGINADFYVTNTDDLLLEVPVPQQSGYKTSLQNIGKIRNTGFELRFSTTKPVKAGPVSWNSSLNMSTNKDKVLALAPGQTQIIGSRNANITRVGGAIAELYGYEVIGIYKTEEELETLPTMAGTQIGDYIIKDVNGDKQIDTKDKRSFGSPAPKVVLGWNNTFNYKNFDLTIDMFSELGKKIFSQTLATSLDAGEGWAVPTKEYFENRYHPVNNPDGIYATPNMANFSNARKEARISNLYFNNASNFTIRSLKLAYTLPRGVVTKCGIQRAQVYFLANNLLVLTPYKGLSVNGGTTDVLNQGYESFNYPLPRTFSFGLNVNF